MHKGAFREKELTDVLLNPGEVPGSSGTRNLTDNISDLKAQIAANHKVIFKIINILFQDILQHLTYLKHIRWLRNILK